MKHEQFTMEQNEIIVDVHKQIERFTTLPDGSPNIFLDQDEVDEYMLKKYDPEKWKTWQKKQRELREKYMQRDEQSLIRNAF